MNWPKLPAYAPTLSEEQNDTRMYKAMDEMNKAKRQARKKQSGAIRDDERDDRNIGKTSRNRRWMNDAYENYEG